MGNAVGTYNDDLRELVALTASRRGERAYPELPAGRFRRCHRRPREGPKCTAEGCSMPVTRPTPLTECTAGDDVPTISACTLESNVV